MVAKNKSNSSSLMRLRMNTWRSAPKKNKVWIDPRSKEFRAVLARVARDNPKAKPDKLMELATKSYIDSLAGKGTKKR